MVKRLSSGWFWMGALFLVGVLVVVWLLPKVAVHEIGQRRSPDGCCDAVLLAVPRDPAGQTSIKVCLQSAKAPPKGNACNEVAYLSGVDDAPDSVAVMWKSPLNLEIRYRHATAVHLYQPAVLLGNSYRARRYRSVGSPILVNVVQTERPFEFKSSASGNVMDSSTSVGADGP